MRIGVKWMANNPVMILFGGTGDLTFRKLLPALYNLEKTSRLAADFHCLIIGRQPFDQDTYHEKMAQWVKAYARLKFDETLFASFKDKFTYLKMDFNEYEGYDELKRRLDEISVDRERLYYYAVAPSSFITITQHLKKAGLVDRLARDGVIIEKPFGDNLQSARDINQVMEQSFQADLIFRIDHYLAKEMIQNILTVRFANSIFAGIWNKDYIDNIQITAAEQVGVEDRGNYYDHSGALKDMVQNHLLQVLSIVTMDEPLDFSAQAIHSAQYEILKHLDFAKGTTLADHLVLGQYHVAQETENNLSYVHENRVQPDSQTETYVAMELRIDQDRFRDVPIYLRTGKRINRRTTEIVIEFKPVKNGGQLKNDVLIIRVQPDEGIYFRFNIKKPGQNNDIETVFMDFCQSCIYENRINTPEAYERLLNAAFHRDGSLFTSWDIVENNWAFVEQIDRSIQEYAIPVELYESFSSGPSGAERLLAQTGRHWIEEKVMGDDYQIDDENGE